MKLEVSYRTGTAHEVEIATSSAVLGRDPACDIVLNDTKCSRRHALIEDGPTGLVVSDCASANGIYLNGKRVERAPLRPGDRLRLGDVQIRVLEEIGQTVVVAAEDFELVTGQTAIPAATPPPQPRPPGAVPVPAPAAPTPPPLPHRPASPTRPAARAPKETLASGARRRVLGRPTTVSVLAVLWAAAAPSLLAAALLLAGRARVSPLGWVLAGTAGLALAAFAGVMALGLRSLAPWARQLQIAAAALGLLACPFTLASATVLLYLTRPEVKDAFERGGPVDPAAEPTFALSLVGMLVLGLALTALAALVVHPAR